MTMHCSSKVKKEKRKENKKKKYFFIVVMVFHITFMLVLFHDKKCCNCINLFPCILCNLIVMGLVLSW